jgi:hypothetical protein
MAFHVNDMMVFYNLGSLLPPNFNHTLLDVNLFVIKAVSAIYGTTVLCCMYDHANYSRKLGAGLLPVRKIFEKM